MNDEELYQMYKDQSLLFLHNNVRRACRYGKLEHVEFLLSSPKLDKHPKIVSSNESLLTIAAENGHLDIVRYLLNSPNLKEKADIHFNSDSPLINACSGRHINIVKYLLKSSELKEHANINARSGRLIILAGHLGDIELIKYLLTSSELKEHSNIHACNDEFFERMLLNEQFDIAKYIIFDYRIEETEAIKKLLLNPEDEIAEFSKEIEKMFELRKLSDTLNNQLPNGNKPSRLNKL